MCGGVGLEGVNLVSMAIQNQGGAQTWTRIGPLLLDWVPLLFTQGGGSLGGTLGSHSEVRRASEFQPLGAELDLFRDIPLHVWLRGGVGRG